MYNTLYMAVYALDFVFKIDILQKYKHYSDFPKRIEYIYTQVARLPF